MTSFWSGELLAIVMLLGVIALVLSRLPRVDLGHSKAFLRRRLRNWLPVGMTYAFLYMGRYNLNTLTDFKVLTKPEFSQIYFWGTLTYGFSFLLNGPLTDKLGGKKTIMISAAGSAVANTAMGLILAVAGTSKLAASHPRWLVNTFSVLYATNMYFQSFGAVSIVKVNSAWFHLRERGTFGGIFGVLISLGIYFAFDWSLAVGKNISVPAVFFTPAVLLVVLAAIDAAAVSDTPSQAGFEDFDVGDAGSESEPPPSSKDPYRENAAPARPGVIQIAKRMLSNPAILTIALIEFCSGYLRNAIMQYFRPYAKDTGITSSFVYAHWGMLLCVAGILGGMFAGVISDRVFQSRRGPVSAVLYGFMLVGSLVMFPMIGTGGLGWTVVFMSLCIIGVHGMLSGTASMDFGGKQNTGIAVGIIDGFVYLGTAAEAGVLGLVLPEKVAAKQPSNWWTWPAAMVPFALIGFLLALRVWNARATKSSAH